MEEGRSGGYGGKIEWISYANLFVGSLKEYLFVWSKCRKRRSEINAENEINGDSEI